MCENHVAVQMSLCSQCVRKAKEKAVKFVASLLDFEEWTSQGLNLGPPDYESVALTN